MRHLCSLTSLGGCGGADINTFVGGKLEVEGFHGAWPQFSLGIRQQSHLLTRGVRMEWEGSGKDLEWSTWRRDRILSTDIAKEGSEALKAEFMISSSEHPAVERFQSPAGHPHVLSLPPLLSRVKWLAPWPAWVLEEQMAREAVLPLWRWWISWGPVFQKQHAATPGWNRLSPGVHRLFRH